MKTVYADKVTFKVDTKVTHRAAGGTQTETLMLEGWILGNVGGYHGGVDVTTCLDGSIMLSMTAEGYESYSGIPAENIIISPERR